MKNLLAALCLMAIIASCSAPTQEAETADTPPPPPPPSRGIELGDESLIDIAKQGLDAMTAQDLDGFTAAFTDDAVYQFNSGDSLAGIDQIREYWQGRMDVIETISFSQEIFLPVTVTEYQAAGPGDWVLAWFNVQATYSGGGAMGQSIHTAYHFTADKKIDRVVQWLDRVPIMQAQEGGGAGE